MYVQLIDARLKDEQGWKTINEMVKDWERDESRRVPGFIGAEWLRDRRDPLHVVSVVRFENAEKAQQNSSRPETNQFYQRMLELVVAPPTFVDCDQVEA